MRKEITLSPSKHNNTSATKDDTEEPTGMSEKEFQTFVMKKLSKMQEKTGNSRKMRKLFMEMKKDFHTEINIL